MDFNGAIALEGYLEKQAPNIIKIFQKRYFTFRNRGQFLVWFKKKPNSVEDQPKGFIKVADIVNIKQDQQDQRVFEIKYPERTFVLKAENKAMREKWVESIEIVRVQALRMTKYLQRKIELEKSDKGRAWRWQEAADQEVKLIRLENEKLILNDNQDTIYETANKFQTDLMGFQIDYEVEKNVLFGCFNKKNFIKTDTKWYLMCSECNLYEEGDQEPNDKVFDFLQKLENKLNNNSSPKKVKKKESSQDSDEEPAPQINKLKFKINCLYEFDLKSKKPILTLPLLQIESWQENITQSPFFLKIAYMVYKSQSQLVSQTKELLLFSNYLTQIKKWAQALKICFQRYSIAKDREKVLDNKFIRYQVKMYRKNDEQAWRKIGSEDKPQFVYLNREFIKIGGYNFKLEDVISPFKSEKIKLDQEEQEEKKEAGCSFEVKTEKITIIFAKLEDEKAFRKRAKKFLKKLEPYLQEKKIKQIKQETQEVNVNTYFIDKKIRQSTSSIKMNFYDMMQQQYPSPKRQKQTKEASFFDRFLSMFCSAPIEQDLYS